MSSTLAVVAVRELTQTSPSSGTTRGPQAHSPPGRMNEGTMYVGETSGERGKRNVGAMQEESKKVEDEIENVQRNIEIVEKKIVGVETEIANVNTKCKWHTYCEEV